ncbi:MAG: hypothetical protein SPI12_06155 [Actinomycetaceae bacterium]|nr:hypothetical protein [Actinomycetaceae bacterium]MDY6083419.1 hypothetical protein [Actinomycetaceae bacterium]
MLEVSNEEDMIVAVAKAAQSGEAVALKQSVTLTSTLVLPEGVTLTAVGRNPLLLAFPHGDGIGLTKNNTVKNIAIQTQASSRALYLVSAVDDLGTMTLSNLRVSGIVQLMMHKPATKLAVKASHVDVVSADARAYSEQQLKYGVVVEQGAFTIHNFNADPSSLITATLDDISAGRPEAPVIGSGVYVAGFSDEGGKVEVDSMTTGEIHSTGMIPQNQPNRITGGIFILSGAHAHQIVSHGSVTTYGVNDMVLDVWGEVDSWIAEAPVRSYGTSGVGFVNFGTVHHFEAKDVLETFGAGARAFNQYDGTIDDATFADVRTHADGSVGMQFSKPVGNLHVTGNIVTEGGFGDSLVKGVIVQLPATAYSLKEGSLVKRMTVDGDIITHGDGVDAVMADSGQAQEFILGGSIRTLGQNAKKVVVENGGKLGDLQAD